MSVRPAVRADGTLDCRGAAPVVARSFHVFLEGDQMSKKTHAMLVLTTALPLLTATAQAATTIRVPQDYSTIQAAINAAKPTDTVLVGPGTYYEWAIDFKGKAITVTSSDGPEKTIIDANGRDSVVRFHRGETRYTVLSGFTLQNGSASQYPMNGGGVQIDGAGPTIRGNVIRNNRACSGSGISAERSFALIEGNHIHHNTQEPCVEENTGGGLLIGERDGEYSVDVDDNIIEYNSAGMDGGGIGMVGGGYPRFANNTIRFNTAGGRGGGVSVDIASTPTFVNNAVYGNTSAVGGGIALFVAAGDFGGYYSNNTVADNQAVRASELYTTGFAASVRFKNNIFFTSKGTNSIVCDDLYQIVSPMFRHNDVHATNGASVGGVCAVTPGGSTNMAVDPKFTGTGKGVRAYELAAGSPAIDAGEKPDSYVDHDLLGHRRRIDGDGDGRRQYDLGALEYRPR